FLTHRYDYIILGGGTAGLTLAARLSADPTLTVGVLEAGELEDSNPLVYTPGLYGVALGGNLDWGFSTVPQEHVNNRSIPWSRGRMLGGSSGLNYMAWNVGAREEYDWGHGWDWEVISAAWKKAETLHLPKLATQLELLTTPPVEQKFHGNNGPVSTSFVLWSPSITDKFLPSLEKLGIKIRVDSMGGENTGAFNGLASIDPEKVIRSYSANAYLLPHIDRENLIVLTGATVSRVILEEGTARGVEFLDINGTLHCASLNSKEKSEIILSAGSIQSPQILELSGIGRESVLAGARVPLLVRNDHIGENLQDHTYCPLIYELTPNNPTRDLFRTSTSFLASATAEYESKRTGILTSTTLAFAMLPLPSILPPSSLQNLISTYSNPDPFTTFSLPRSPTDSTVAQIELIFAPFKIAGPPPEPGKSYLSLLTALMHPLSRGSVHISSPDPRKPPVIDPRYYCQPVDKAVLLAGVKFAEKVVEQEPLRSVLAKRVDVVGEGEEGLWEWVKGQISSVEHPVGTCAIGLAVDGELRVKGVKGLRVVDASVIPEQIAAHMQATVYGVAERAAEIIIE
ncbi:hypothetical protein BDD12DRAFT_656195, partial [Trichophaea hybrida]